MTWKSLVPVKNLGLVEILRFMQPVRLSYLRVFSLVFWQILDSWDSYHLHISGLRSSQTGKIATSFVLPGLCHCVIVLIVASMSAPACQSISVIWSLFSIQNGKEFSVFSCAPQISTYFMSFQTFDWKLDFLLSLLLMIWKWQNGSFVEFGCFNSFDKIAPRNALIIQIEWKYESWCLFGSISLSFPQHWLKKIHIGFLQILKNCSVSLLFLHCGWRNLTILTFSDALKCLFFHSLGRKEMLKDFSLPLLKI